MFTGTGAGTVIDAYDPHLLRLLVVRAALPVDPAPDLPPVDEPPDDVRLPPCDGGGARPAAWRAQWHATLHWLDHPDRHLVPGGRPSWPASLPTVDEQRLFAWRRSLPVTPRGTPLLDRPSYRYHLARAENDELPGRLVVLPLSGPFSGRPTSTLGIVSASSFFGSDDRTFGL